MAGDVAVRELKSGAADGRNAYLVFPPAAGASPVWVGEDATEIQADPENESLWMAQTSGSGHMLIERASFGEALAEAIKYALDRDLQIAEKRRMQGCTTT